MKFITLSSHRSGSSMLQRFLNTHPDVYARQEDLRDQDRIGQLAAKRRLDEIFAQEGKYKAVGTKVQYTHVRPWLLKYIKQNDVKVIQLIRRDLLQTIFWWPGNYEGKTKGGFGPELVVPVGSVIIGKYKPVKKMLIWLKKQIDKYKKIADFVLYLEDDIRGPEDSDSFYNPETRKKLFQFLGVKDIDIVLPQKRADTDNLEKYVANYGDLLKKLKKEGVPIYYEG